MRAKATPRSTQWSRRTHAVERRTPSRASLSEVERSRVEQGAGRGRSALHQRLTALHAFARLIYNPACTLDLAPDSPVSPTLRRRLRGLYGAAARAAGGRAGLVEERREIDVLRACSAAIDHDSARAARFNGRPGRCRAPADRAVGHVVTNDAAIDERGRAAGGRTKGGTEGQHTQENVVVGAVVKLSDLKAGGVIAFVVVVGHDGARGDGAYGVVGDGYLVQRVIRRAGVSNHLKVPGGGGRGRVGSASSENSLPSAAPGLSAPCCSK